MLFHSWGAQIASLTSEKEMLHSNLEIIDKQIKDLEEEVSAILKRKDELVSARGLSDKEIENRL
jgi:hypothetical protein